jgi:multiple sugar transport system permease protein
MFRQSISQISDEMLEAARVDGASDWFIFHKIILPMSRNTISSLAIFQFLWSWEDFLWPYLMINDQSKQLLPVGLRLFNGQYGTDYGGLFAATSISIIPVIIIYLIFQKQFIAGIQSGTGK